MSGINRTSRREFFLLGFNHFQSLTPFLFTLFLIVYILTMVGNVLVVILVSISHRLKTPMYLFLRNLSICEVLFTTNIVPKMLQVLLQGGSTISFTGCMTQLYMFGATGMAECLLLTSMSYDRYLAICKPLHYSSIMNFKQHLYLVMFSWLYGLVLPVIAIGLIYSFDFCDSNALDHFFCDLAPILELSCSDTSIMEFEVFAQSIPIFIFTFIYIVGTYFKIFLAIMRIPSQIGRQKAFSTCSSHLTVVCTYYGTMIILYVTPNRRQSKTVNKTLSLLYSVVTPLLNPVIYSLRNQEIRKSLSSLFKRKV
ncbi:olfactory receptor 10A3-like [Ranitomeya variabilis]|uniref:olfactory receptor 10A3-like n=1 Tax=Ranitomeya variabilis TaxID=490064 RepID=UPI004057A6F8